ncbi:Protein DETOXIFICATION 16 [Linum perenne]
MDHLPQHTKPSTDLQTPLILAVDEEESKSKFTKSEIVDEVKKQLWLAGPLVSVNFLTYMLQVISVMFVGHLGELPLAGASMATSFASVTSITLLESHVKFLQSQNNVLPVAATTGFATLLHVVVCWALVFKSGLGNRGAAMANGVAYWINGVSLFVYVRVSRSCKSSWTGWSMEAFQGIPGFVRLAVPSAVMLSLEIWSFEMMVLLAGLLPNPKLETSVLSISLNTSAIVYMLPLGISATASTRVSNELGGGRPRAARLAVYVSVAIVVTETIVTTTIMVLGHNVWGYLYSKEEEVVRYVGDMMLLSAAFHMFDGIQSVLSGICRGCGRQNIGAIVNLGAYYLLGVPCSIVLAFVYHWGGKGLWTGITLALFSQAVFMTVLTVNTNWEKEAKKAKDRVYNAISEEGSLLL